MLRINPLHPPRPFTATRSMAANVALPGPPVGFVAADDFDATGIMAGIDPSESRYWWLPELYGPEAAADSAEPVPATATAQATSRTGSRAAAAA